MNIPGLIEIEYTPAEDTGIPVFANGAVSSTCFTGDFLPVDFAPTTGGVTSECARGDNGNLSHRTELSFYVPETTAVNRAEIDLLAGGRYVFRVTDAQGLRYIVGDQDHPARVQYTMQVDAAYTGRRGFAVTAVSISLNGPMLYEEDETESSAS